MGQRVVILGRRLASLRRERYLTQEEFAQKLEMSPANIRRLEQSETGGMQVKNFRRLAMLLNVSPDDLKRQIGVKEEPGAHERDSATATLEPPVGGLEFPPSVRPATRRGITDVSHYHGVSAARVESRTDINRGKAPVPAGNQRRFAVTVDGDCMEPKYRDGDVVVFSVDAAEREGIVDGKSYFIQFTGEENTFKRIFRDPENHELLILRCWNERYPQRIVERAKITLLARATHRLVTDD